MNDVLRMGKRIFTVSVVVTTIAWSIGLAALLLPLAASAATLTSGDLIKASQPAVYYYGADGKRYVFPNEKTFKTWFSDFSSVKKITDAELAAISIGGNVTYKPGVKMVKITTDPKVYAVDAGGALRWINSETVAAALYGGNWAKSVEDVPDAFFVNYKTGGDIAMTSDFVKTTVESAASSINVDKGLASAVTGGTGALSFALASDSPASASVVTESSSGNGGQLRAPFLKFVMSAGSAAVNVSAINFKRGGISKDGDISNALLMEGSNVLAEANSVSVSGVRFTFASGELVIPANSSKTLTLAINLARGMASGSTMNFSLASADVTSDAASVSGVLAGNTMTNAVVTDLGYLAVGTMVYPASVDPGATNKEMVRIPLTAGAQDILVTYLKLVNLGSSYDSDIQNVKLMDAATQLNGVVAVVKDKAVEFDMTGMSGGGYKILAGQTKQITLNADIVSGTNRTFQWSIQKQYDLRATDIQYNTQAFVDNNTRATWAVVKAAAATTINVGTLSVSVAADSPSSNIPDAATGVTLAKFNFKASGEDVKVTDLTVICTGSTTARTLKNSKVLLDGVQVGSSDTSAICDATTDEYVLTFGNSFIIGAGKTGVVSIVADTTSSSGTENWAANDTVYVGFGGTGVAQGKSSLTSITPTNISGRTLTVKTGTVSVIKNSSFTDRSSTFPTGVANASNQKVGSFVIIAGAGESVDVSQIVLRDNATYFMGNNFQNLVLKDSGGNQVGSTISSLNTSDSTYTFTPATSIRILNGQQMAFDVYADVKGSVTNAGSAYTMLEADTVSATGVLTSASANFGTAGHDSTDVALQNVYLSLHGLLTIDEAADTPVAQQLVLGSTGIELVKFKLSASAVEDIEITQFVVQDDMSTGFGLANNKAATGSIKNFKLYNGSTLLASVASLDDTSNTVTPYATFTGFTLKVPKNQNLTLTVKADLTSYDDGGKPSSSHRILFPVSYSGDANHTAANYTLGVTAVGAGSGIAMSLTGLDILGGTATAGSKANVVGSYMDMVRSKLTLAFAADTPSGASSRSSEQTVAKFVATNSANVGNYSLTIKGMNFAVSSAGASISANSAFKVYKDSITTANQLISSNYTYTSGVGCTSTNCEFVKTDITKAGFTDFEIAAGSNKTVIVTLDTSNSGLGTNDTLSIGLDASSALVNPSVFWTDGNSDSINYQTIDTLPLAGKTLVY